VLVKFFETSFLYMSYAQKVNHTYEKSSIPMTLRRLEESVYMISNFLV